jgi:hypothetical protein
MLLSPYKTLFIKHTIDLENVPRKKKKDKGEAPRPQVSSN